MSETSGMYDLENAYFSSYSPAGRTQNLKWNGGYKLCVGPWNPGKFKIAPKTQGILEGIFLFCIIDS